MKQVVLHDVAHCAGSFVKAAAVTNAIWHATGVRVRDLPATPDRLLAGLRVDSLATVLVARVEPMIDGVTLVRWSSAGHPPPVLALADGTTQTLLTDGELLLGLDPAVVRSNHEIVLEAGAVLQAQLYAPSKAVGFIRPGDAVLLREYEPIDEERARADVRAFVDALRARGFVAPAV